MPTALIVQDCLGGTLERLATDYQGKQETHYRNIIDGTTIDLTRNQYPEDQVFTPAPVEGDLRTYVPVSYTHLDVYKRQMLYPGCRYTQQL